MAKWYYSINGTQQGPVDEEEMRAMLASGLIQPSSLIWRDGMDSWQSLSSHPEWMGQITSPGGTPIPAYQTVPPTNGLAIASMVCGLVSLPLMLGCSIGIVTAIPAVICGHMSLSQIKRSPQQSGRGFAITGVVTGYLTILFTVIVLIVIGIAFSSDLHRQ